MDDIQRRQSQRLIVMQAIYERSGSSETTSVSGQDLLNDLAMSDQELGDACEYLEGEYLIKGSRTMWAHLTPSRVNMTHRGIKEMEQSIQAPTKPTEHFPPAISIVNISGTVIGSPIQSGSPGAQQESHIDLKLGDIREFVKKLENSAQNLGLQEEQQQELTAEIATIKAQIESPKPKKHIIRESLGAVQGILVGAGGNLAATGLLDILQHIHF